jgi:hypothetical protein
MGTRNGVAPDVLLGLDHLPCPQIVKLPLIAADHGAQARSKRDRCCPNRVWCTARILACVKCSRALVPMKDWVPLTIARKKDLCIALVRADLDDLSRRRNRRYVGLVAEKANTFGHGHRSAPFLQRDWCGVFIRIFCWAADVKTVGNVSDPYSNLAAGAS